MKNSAHADWLRFYAELLKCRRINIVPRMNDVQPGKATYNKHGTRDISVLWPLKANGRLALLANFGDDLLQIASGLVDLHNGGRPHRFA